MTRNRECEMSVYSSVELCIFFSVILLPSKSQLVKPNRSFYRDQTNAKGHQAPFVL